MNQLDARFAKDLNEVNKQEDLCFDHKKHYVAQLAHKPELLVWYSGCGSRSSAAPMTPRKEMGRLEGRVRPRTRMRPVPCPTLHKYSGRVKLLSKSGKLLGIWGGTQWGNMQAGRQTARRVRRRLAKGAHVI
jgi:hypothetical protein